MINLHMNAQQRVIATEKPSEFVSTNDQWILSRRGNNRDFNVSYKPTKNICLRVAAEELAKANMSVLKAGATLKAFYQCMSYNGSMIFTHEGVDYKMSTGFVSDAHDYAVVHVSIKHWHAHE